MSFVFLAPVLASPIVANAAIIFDDGATHTINTFVNQTVIARDASGPAPTHIEVLFGASILSDTDDASLLIEQTSTAEVFSGFFAQDIAADDNATITVHGGLMNDDINAYGNSVINVHGGFVSEDLAAFDSAELNFYDGSTQYVYTEANGVVNIHGGTVRNDIEPEGGIVNVFGGSVSDDIEADGDSLVRLYGGSFGEDIEASDSSNIEIRGGTLNAGPSSLDTGLGVWDDGEITIYGSNFRVNLSSVGPGPIIPRFGFVTGTLADGSDFRMPFRRFQQGDIILVQSTPVPEPSAVVLVVMGIFGLGLLRFRRKK